MDVEWVGGWVRLARLRPSAKPSGVSRREDTVPALKELSVHQRRLIHKPLATAAGGMKHLWLHLVLRSLIMLFPPLATAFLQSSLCSHIPPLHPTSHSFSSHTLSPSLPCLSAYLVLIYFAFSPSPPFLSVNFDLQLLYQFLYLEFLPFLL